MSARIEVEVEVTIKMKFEYELKPDQVSKATDIQRHLGKESHKHLSKMLTGNMIDENHTSQAVRLKGSVMRLTNSLQVTAR